MPLPVKRIGGAPSRRPFSLPLNQGPLAGPNRTAYRPNVSALGTPQAVIDVSDYPGGAITLFYTLGPSDVLAVNRPAQGQLRSVLLLRSSAASPSGSEMYVAFGTSAADNTAWYALPPGGIIYLDSRVPQDDIHIAGSVASVLAIVGYANYIVQPQG